jgi:ribosomal protein RSM22 (predicted rRNA methylase)
LELPSALLTAIEEARAGRSARELSQAYEALSARYRRENEAQDLFIRNEAEALAYSAARLPATYSANAKVFEILKNTVPDFQPQTLCDMGAGPGTAAFAAFSVWGDTLAEAQLVEPNAPLRTLGQELVRALGVKARYERERLEAFSLSRMYDLVLASYVLNEVETGSLDAAVQKLWQAAGEALVLVETGTPFGYQTLMRAREVLLGQADAHIAAPCPHRQACPLTGGENWCHFSVRVQRPSLHRQVKPGASLSYEDEKFCYLVVMRREVARPAARIVGAPKGGKVLSIPLCREDGGFAVRQTSKRDPDFPRLKRLDWGDAVPDTPLQ